MKNIVLLLLLSSALPGVAKKRPKSGSSQTTHVAARKRECEEQCAAVHEDDRLNCVLRCQSEACYEQVYASNELEPGEIDLGRQRQFQSCVNTESREQHAAARKRKKPAEAKVTVASDGKQEPEANTEL